MELETINKMEKLCKDLKKEGYQPRLTIKRDNLLIITIPISLGDVEKITKILEYRRIAGE